MSVAGLGNTYSSPVLASLLGSGTPANWNARLMITMPTDDANTGAVAVSYTGYADVPVTNNSTNFPAPTVVGGFDQVTIQAAIAFAPVVTGSTIAVTGIVAADGRAAS